MIWVIAKGDEECGAVGVTDPHGRRCMIPAGQPMALLGPADWPLEKRKKRCAAHAGAPVDEAAVDAARLELERKALEGETEPPAVPQFVARTSPKRHRPSKPVKPFAEVRQHHDPRMAAAGDRE